MHRPSPLIAHSLINAAVYAPASNAAPSRASGFVLWRKTEVIPIWNDVRSSPKSGLRSADDQRVYEFTP